MRDRKRTIAVYTSLLWAVVPLGSCSEAGLYKWNSDPFLANKLTVSGKVCSDDPRQRDFPVKVLFLVDTTPPVLASANDSSGQRGKAIANVIGLWGSNRNYSFGVISYGGQVRNLVTGGFTRDTSLLTAASTTVQGSSGGCRSGRCRDLRGAVSLASSIITGDILAGDKGQVARTSYVVVLFANGPPIPAIDRCTCRDRKTEKDSDKWANCEWKECDSTGSGTSASCPASNLSTDNCPDTYSHWVLPADPVKNGLKQKPAGCKACDFCCIWPAGGRAGSCEEKTMVGLVRELKTFAIKNGAAQFQFHTTYLPDRVTNRPSTDPFSPPSCTCSGGKDCSTDALQARTVRLLSEMAFAGNGSFKQYGKNQPVTFRHVDLFTARDPLVYKELVVTNRSALPGPKGLLVDSDHDGLDDATEKRLQTCPRDPDTDGDGVSDNIELKLARDPLKKSEPLECVDLTSTLRQDVEDLCGTRNGSGQLPTKSWRVYDDDDKDGLNACEERLLGTDDTLVDSDADGIPDPIELISGTNYLAIDSLKDPDFDGVLNRNEVRGHTDPRANDAQEQLDLAYRYEQFDEGIKTVLSFSPTKTITGITIKSASSSTEAGVGYLEFTPGSGGKAPSLRWRDPGDLGSGTSYGPQVPVGTPAKSVKLPSYTKDRVLTVQAAGPDFYPPKQTVDRIVISGAKRNCIRFRVRNITLVSTEAAWIPTPNGYIQSKAGDNTVYLYFSEAPKDGKDGYGIFRVASVVLNYQQGPPASRTPKKAELKFADEDFVVFE